MDFPSSFDVALVNSVIFSCVWVVVVSIVFTVSFVVLLVVISVVLSLVVLSLVEISFVVLSCVLGQAGVDFFIVPIVVDSLVVLGGELCEVVDSAVVNFGVVDFSVVIGSLVVASGVVDFSVVVDSVVVDTSNVVLEVLLLSTVLGTTAVPFVTVDCVVFTTVVLPSAIGEVVVLVEAVEFGPAVVELTSETFGAEVTSTVVDEVAFRLAVIAVLFTVDVTLFAVSVAFAELCVTFAVAGDCVALETATSFEELTLLFTQTSAK